MSSRRALSTARRSTRPAILTSRSRRSTATCDRRSSRRRRASSAAARRPAAAAAVASSSGRRSLNDVELGTVALEALGQRGAVPIGLGPLLGHRARARTAPCSGSASSPWRWSSARSTWRATSVASAAAATARSPRLLGEARRPGPPPRRPSRLPPRPGRPGWRARGRRPCTTQPEDENRSPSVLTTVSSGRSSATSTARGPVAAHSHHPVEQTVEHLRHRRRAGAHVSAQETPHRRGRVARRPTRHPRTMHAPPWRRARSPPPRARAVWPSTARAAPDPSTTMALRAAPTAASKAATHPSSMSTRSFRTPSTPAESDRARRPRARHSRRRPVGPTPRREPRGGGAGALRLAALPRRRVRRRSASSADRRRCSAAACQSGVLGRQALQSLGEVAFFGLATRRAGTSMACSRSSARASAPCSRSRAPRSGSIRPRAMAIGLFRGPLAGEIRERRFVAGHVAGQRVLGPADLVRLGCQGVVLGGGGRRARPTSAPHRPRAWTPRRCRPRPPGRGRCDRRRSATTPSRPRQRSDSPCTRVSATTRSSSRWVASSAAVASAAASSSAIEVTSGGFALGESITLGRGRLAAGVEAGELPADEVQPKGAQLLGQRCV